MFILAKERSKIATTIGIAASCKTGQNCDYRSTAFAFQTLSLYCQ